VQREANDPDQHEQSHGEDQGARRPHGRHQRPNEQAEEEWKAITKSHEKPSERTQDSAETEQTTTEKIVEETEDRTKDQHINYNVIIVDYTTDKMQ
jgi:hypothetical protein